MKITTVLSAVAAFVLSQSAQADDAGGYLGGGVAFGGASTVCTNTTAYCNKFTSDAQNGGGPAIIGGYDFNKYVGAEAGWTRLGTYRVPNSTGSYIGSVKASATTLALKGGYKFHFGLSVFGKFGFARVQTQYTADPGFAIPASSQRSSGYVAGLGVQYDINDAFGVRMNIEAVSFNDTAYKGSAGTTNLLAVVKF